MTKSLLLIISLFPAFTISRNLLNVSQRECEYGKKERSSHYGVSIIVCTKRHYCMDNLIENFISQRYKHKELIIILNHKELKMKDYIKAAEPYKNIRIYRQPEHVSLGNCLNYGVNMAKYPYIAKFDDDDYYAPDYLKDSMHTLRKTKADIVGKRAHYVYLSSKNLCFIVIVIWPSVTYLRYRGRHSSSNVRYLMR